jgi:hypothetical protein
MEKQCPIIASLVEAVKIRDQGCPPPFYLIPQTFMRERDRSAIELEEKHGIP